MKDKEDIILVIGLFLLLYYNQVRRTECWWEQNFKGYASKVETSNELARNDLTKITGILCL